MKKLKSLYTVLISILFICLFVYSTYKQKEVESAESNDTSLSNPNAKEIPRNQFGFLAESNWNRYQLISIRH